jgi:hypothetical protein
MNDLVRIVGAESLDAMKGFVKGEAADLKSWGEDIALDAIRAARSGRMDIERELAEQVKTLAELKRIKTVGFAWDQIARVVLAVAKVAAEVYFNKSED